MIVWLTGSCGFSFQCLLLPDVGCSCPASWQSFILHIASPGKDQNAKCRVWFLLNACCFYIIIKLKNHKSNHCKLETICSPFHYIFSFFLSTSFFCSKWTHDSITLKSNNPLPYILLKVLSVSPPFSIKSQDINPYSPSEQQSTAPSQPHNQRVNNWYT